MKVSFLAESRPGWACADGVPAGFAGSYDDACDLVKEAWAEVGEAPRNPFASRYFLGPKNEDFYELFGYEPGDQ